MQLFIATMVKKRWNFGIFSRLSPLRHIIFGFRRGICLEIGVRIDISVKNHIKKCYERLSQQIFRKVSELKNPARGKNLKIKYVFTLYRLALLHKFYRNEPKQTPKNSTFSLKLTESS